MQILTYPGIGFAPLFGFFKRPVLSLFRWEQ